MIELLSKLIEIESISGNEGRLVDFLFTWLSKNDLSVQRLGNNLCVEVKTEDWHEGDKTILLCSHIDTVPPCSGWTKDPFRAVLEDGKIYGLGANDALASVVSMIYALKNSRSDFKRARVILAIVCEEEKGSKGFVSIEPSLPRYDYGIFGEPTSLRIGYCMRGSMKIKLLTKGKSCHASRPHEGNNAIYNLIEDLSVLRALPLKDDSPWGGATVEPTIINGGSAENQIPDLVETLLDIRPTFKVDNDKILELLSNSGLRYEVIRNIRRPMACDPESPLIAAIRRAVPNAPLYPFGGSCDMAFAKAPSVVFGPGASERSHSADEFILIEELNGACTAYSSILDRFFGEKRAGK